MLVPIVTLIGPSWAWGRLHRSRGAGRAAVALVLAIATMGGACIDGEKGSSGTPDGVPPDSALRSARWTVRLDGAGPISYGMTIAQAEAAAKDSISAPPDPGQCAFVRFRGMPEGMHFMVEQGRIVRADVADGTLATDRGVRVGMAEAEVQALHDGVLEARPHKYDAAGRYLVLVPEDADSLRFIFETDGSVVTRYRAGLLPAIEYVEGCG